MRTCSPKPHFFLLLIGRDFAAVYEIKNQKTSWAEVEHVCCTNSSLTPLES